MKFKTTLLAAGFALVVSAVQAALPVIGPAPAWKLKTLEGREVSSTDFKGKVVVVDFWATWCPPCRAEIPGYIELQKKYADKGLVILGLSLDDAGVEVVQKFATAQKINYPILLDASSAAEAFGDIRSIPTTFLIDKDGNIRHKKVGAAKADAYEKIVAELLE